MSNLRICPINFVDEAPVFSALSPMAPNLPITNAQLTSRDSPARSISNGDLVILGHWNGNGRKVDSLFFFRHNCHGGKLRLLLFKDIGFTSAVYDSGALEISALSPIDVDWGTAPLGVASNDLLALESPFSFFFPAVACSAFGVILSRCQAPYWEIGRMFLGKYLEAPYNPDYGMRFGWQSNTVQKRTPLSASLRTRPGDRWREFGGNLIYTADADRAVWRDLLGRISLEEDVAVSIFPGAGGRLERDHVANMQLSAHSAFTWPDFGSVDTAFNFVEV